MMHKVHLDNIIFSLQDSGGVSLFWSELCSRVSVESYTEFSGATNNVIRRELEIDASRVRTSRIPARVALRLPPALINSPEPVFHSSYYRVTPHARNVVTIHDVIYERYRSGAARLDHMRLKRNVIRYADMLVFVSETTRRDFLDLYGDTDAHCEIVPNGVSPQFHPISSDQLHATGKDFPMELPDRFILFVGNRPGYKNFEFSVECARAAKIGLVAVGGGPMAQSEIAQINRRLDGRFVHLTISTEMLNYLYNRALALLYPSRYEGFGLPPLEAMRAGCPVVCLRTPALIEVLGDAPVYLDSESTGEFVRVLGDLARDSIRGELQGAGAARASRYTWDVAAAAYDHIYQRMEER